MALRNFVDRETVIYADWLNGVDRRLNGTSGDSGSLAAPTGAASIGNAPAGNIAATNVQAALNELDTEKVASATLAASTGAAGVGFIQAGAGSVATTVAAKLNQVVNIKDKGAATGSSNATNRAALQTAIADVNVAGGGVITIDYDINWGYKTRTAATWPDYTGVTKPIIIFDYSRGDTQSPTVYPTGYDGAMCRVLMFTPQTTTFGAHDGNTQWLRGDWAPAYCISNDANLAAVGNPARLATDNRRAYYATFVDGSCSWQWGNGILAGAGYTDEELSDFLLQKFEMPGDTLGTYTVFNNQRLTGNTSYGGGRSVPNAHHHFEAVTGSPALDLMMLESKSTTCTAVLRNSDGSGDDVYYRNIDGALTLGNVNGTALDITKADRRVGIGVSPALYKFDVADSRAGDYMERLRNTNATNGFIANWTSSSAAGTGWDFLDAYSDAGSDIKFRLRGDGNGYCDGAWAGGGADRAEMLEWADGNPDGWDGDKKEVGSNRVGYSVVVEDGMIRFAQPGEIPVGIISVRYDSLGNASSLKWDGKYLKDDFGRCVTEDGSHKINPDYDPASVYVPRDRRKEWDAVGVLGVIPMRKGQPTDPRWIKMRDISETVEEWLVR